MNDFLAGGQRQEISLSGIIKQEPDLRCHPIAMVERTQQGCARLLHKDMRIAREKMMVSGRADSVIRIGHLIREGRMINFAVADAVDDLEQFLFRRHRPRGTGHELGEITQCTVDPLGRPEQRLHEQVG